MKKRTVLFFKITKQPKTAEEGKHKRVEILNIVTNERTYGFVFIFVAVIALNRGQS